MFYPKWPVQDHYLPLLPIRPHALYSLLHSLPITKYKRIRLRPIEWVETARYLGVTLDTRLTWSAYINQAGRKAAQRLDVLGPLLNRRSGLSIRNGMPTTSGH
jgi:hypothetical protein